jgi:hypothetical protein
MIWRDAVLEALRRYSVRHSTKNIDRQSLINEDLDWIISQTSSIGETPSQTLSRVLQELRDEGILFFLTPGTYLLLESPISAEAEDLPEGALEFAAQNNKLTIGILPTSDELALARRRRGQEKIRRVTLENYHRQCALCDVRDIAMLIAGHIARWTDDMEGRGDLTNLICMCKFHDALFESGYFSLANNYEILKKPEGMSKTINYLLRQTEVFRAPTAYPPAASYLTKHRIRSGF